MRHAAPNLSSSARRKADSEFTFDVDLALKQNDENPVFYVQYAHARTVNVARNAAAAGVRRTDGFDASLLDHESEAVVSWSAGPDPAFVHGDHPSARRVADAYHDLRGGDHLTQRRPRLLYRIDGTRA